MNIRSTSAWLGCLLVGCNYYDWGSYDTDPSAELEGDPFFSAEEWAKIRTHGPLGDPPPDPTNKYADDPDAAILGQKLYFETGFSGSFTTWDSSDDDDNCATCHDPTTWFGAVTEKVDGWRNTPPVVNAAFYDWFLWDGGRDSMWAQSLGPPEQQMHSTRLAVVHVLYDKYRDEYNAVFDPKLPDALDPTHPEADRFPPEGSPVTGADDWNTMTEADRHLVNAIYANFGKALAAYQRRLISGNSRFDRYVEGDDFDLLTDSEKRGLRLFIGEAGCSECHTGVAFTDNDFHNIGVLSGEDPEGRFTALQQVIADEFNTAGDYSDADVGRLEGLQPTLDDLGKFRTKHLRQIAETGQYMHAGQLASLRAVVDYYDDGGPAFVRVGELDHRIRPLGLSDGDKDDLVAFLETLTGEPIDPELLRDISHR